MNFFTRVYAQVRRIPRGKVASYGLIAALCGSPRAARQVGWALHQLDQNPRLMSSIPWHRVINAQGYISTTCHTHTADLQKEMLAKEGIPVVRSNNLWRVDMTAYVWRPKSS